MDSERLARFWAKVDIKKENECWLWTASVNSKGYGSFAIEKKKTALAHKVSWALAYNDGVLSSPKYHVMHSCDVRRCVNPNHLSLGTPNDNVRDAIKKGRAVNPIHSQNPTCRHGHPRTPENTHEKYRTCILCMEASNARAYAKRDKKKYAEYNKAWREAKKKAKLERTDK